MASSSNPGTDAPGASAPDPSSVAPSGRARRGRPLALGALAVLLGLALFHGPLLRRVPRALVLADPEETADAIVVLAGDGGERVEHAVELWKRGRSRTRLLLVSGGPLYWKTTWASLMAEHARALGVPRECVLEQGLSRTTEEDARESLSLLLARPEKDVRSIVLVTSAWHSRRARAEFVRAAEGRVRVTSCPCAEPALVGDWWHDAPATRAIVTELLKYLW